MFRGGWSLEAAEAVTRGVPSPTPLLESLQELVEHSLVTVSHADDAQHRYTMLETIREYAQLKLADRGATQQVRQAHTGYFLDLARTAREHLLAADQLLWLDRLEREHDNLQEALGYADRVGDTETELRLVGDLWRFWYLHSYLTLACHWLDRTLAQPLPESSVGLATRTDVLAGRTSLALVQTDYRRASATAEEGIRLAEQIGDRRNQAYLLNCLAIVARNRSDLARARELGMQAEQFARATHDNWTLALVLHNLADVARIEADYSRAEQIASESLALSTGINDGWGIIQSQMVLAWIAFDTAQYVRAGELFARCREMATALGHTRDLGRALAGLGELALARGELEAAEALLDEAEARWRTVGDAVRLAQVLNVQARLADTRGRADEAAAWILSALALFRSAGHQLGVAECLEALAALIAAGQPDADAAGETVELIAHATRLRELIGAPQAPAEAARHDDFVAAARAQLAPATFEKRWQSGLNDAFEDLVARLSSRYTTAAATPGGPQSPPHSGGPPKPAALNPVARARPSDQR